MPASFSDNGQPRLAVTATCRKPGCGWASVIGAAAAAKIQARLAGGQSMAALLAQLSCQKCGGRLAALSFYLVEGSGTLRKNPAGGPDPRGWPWIGRVDSRGRKVAD